MSLEYDVAIVGAGDVGAAIARELARFELRIVLIDGGDVGAGTSKANTAILHTGFDAKPGTLEAGLVARGHELLLDYAAQAGIPIERTGALLVAWNDEQLARLPAIADERPPLRVRAGARGAAPTSSMPRAAPRTGRAGGRSRCPTSSSSAPGRRRSPTPRRRSLAGVELRRDERVTDLARLASRLAGRDLARER